MDKFDHPLLIFRGKYLLPKDWKNYEEFETNLLGAIEYVISIADKIGKDHKIVMIWDRTDHSGNQWQLSWVKRLIKVLE